MGSPFGINTFMGYREYGGGFGAVAKPDPKDREICLGLVQELGCTTLRDITMAWGEIQPALIHEGYKWEPVDDMLAQAASAELDFLGLFWHLPAWATVGTSDPRPNDFSARDPRFVMPKIDSTQQARLFLEAFTQRYGYEGIQAIMGQCRAHLAYEFGNACDGPHYSEPERYARWLKLFTTTIKTRDPRAIVALGGLTSPGLQLPLHSGDGEPDWLEKVLDSDELKGDGWPYFDLISLRHYPAAFGRPDDPTSLDGSVAYIRRALSDRALPPMPIWLTEIGDDSAQSTPELQARRLPKLLVHALVAGCQKAFWYALTDTDFNDMPQGWGLCEPSPPGVVPNKKPAFEALRVLNDKLADVASVERLGRGAYRCRRQDATACWVLWNDDGAPPPDELSGHLRITSHLGQSQVSPASSLQLSPDPVYAEVLSAA